MSAAPALDALALVEIVEHDRRRPGETAARTEELRALLADPGDNMIHADHAVDVALELAALVLGVAAAGNVPVSQFVADARRRLLAREGPSA